MAMASVAGVVGQDTAVIRVGGQDEGNGQCCRCWVGQNTSVNRVGG
jgi:hypothetical protein